MAPARTDGHETCPDQGTGMLLNMFQSTCSVYVFSLCFSLCSVYVQCDLFANLSMAAQTKAQRLQSQGGGEQGRGEDRGEGGEEGGAARVVTRVPLPRFQSPFASSAVEAAVGSSKETKETWQSKVDPSTGRVYVEESCVSIILHPVYTRYTPVYTRYTPYIHHIYTICTPNTPLNTPYTSYIRPVYTTRQVLPKLRSRCAGGVGGGGGRVWGTVAALLRPGDGCGFLV